MTHLLDVSKEHYEEIKNGKSYLLVKQERLYKCGDDIIIQQSDIDEEIKFNILYIDKGDGVKNNYCILSLYIKAF